MRGSIVQKIPVIRLQVNGMMRITRAFIAVLISVSVPAIAADKTDILIFLNGDRLTGEVKSLERGRLRFDTDATGTISIEWDDVASLESKQNVQVETDNGDRYLGHLSVATERKRIVVETASGSVGLDNEHVVLMAPIEEKGIDRLDGEISAGYNFAKASSVKQVQFGLDMDFRTETRILGLKADVLTSDSEDSEASQRESLDLNYTRLRANRWLTGGMLSFDSNDELGLNLRTSVGVGGGRILHRTNNMDLTLIGGLQLSRENVVGDTSDEDTWEAFAAVNWDWFRYDTPELDFSTNLQVYPNLTDSGRVRGELDVTVKWEIIEDLFWKISFYDSYDSDPVVLDAEKNDYGIVTSIGYEF